MNRKQMTLLLMSIGIANIGSWIYLIALNLFILRETGSALAVALLYMLGPIATICTNVWVGSFIDRINIRRFMITLDVVRALTISAIAFTPSIYGMYVFAFVICLSNAMFEPASNVYMTKLIAPTIRQRFNSLRSFVQSSGSLLGPSIAGLLFYMSSPTTALFITAIAYCFTALLLRSLPHVLQQNEAPQRISLVLWRQDCKMVWTFSKNERYVVSIYTLLSVMTIFMTAIDSIEAAFAIQTLHLTDVQYSLLLTVFGIAYLSGSLVNTIFANSLSVTFLISFGTVATALSYSFFYSTSSFGSIILAISIIGFVIPFAMTGYTTFYQTHIPTHLLGRFLSLFNVIESAVIILATLVIGIVAEQASIRIAGILFSCLFILLSIIALKIILQKRA